MRRWFVASQKLRYIGALADRVCARQLVFDDMTSKNDEAVIEMLTRMPGIGRWTAQMFLIFGLKRLDVLAVGDAGLQRAARLLYGKKRQVEDSAATRRRSVAAVPFGGVVVFVAISGGRLMIILNDDLHSHVLRLLRRLFLTRSR